jgi:DNA ligase-1
LCDIYLGDKKKVLMTATEWGSESMNPTGWYMTEKYDGMRLYWNGSDFYSRQGNKVKVPELITRQMPQIALDGELW